MIPAGELVNRDRRALRGAQQLVEAPGYALNRLRQLHILDCQVLILDRELLLLFRRLLVLVGGLHDLPRQRPNLSGQRQGAAKGSHRLRR